MDVVIQLIWTAIVCGFLQCTVQAVPPCDSQIYCDGELLKTVQLAGLFNDSKTFVDMQLTDEPDIVLEAFKNLTNITGHTKEDDVKSFVSQYFDGPGTEFETWKPTDTVDNPQFLQRIKDTKLKAFGKELCDIWSHLGRKIKSDVRINPQRYSLIYLPNPFIVPGGRFREIYYWDSYWVVKGLLTCEMFTTVKGMLENLLTFVDNYGKIPNGGRIYFQERSQPPLMIAMVHLYVKVTNDTEFITKHIGTLEKEYNFWVTERNVSITTGSGEMHTLNRYGTPLTKPRPESFKEDYRTAEHLSSEAAESLYSNLASGAESGWDFSSRWFVHEKTSTSLTDVIIKNIIPVDLNSILCWNERLLANFFAGLGNNASSMKYSQLAEKRTEAIQQILWNNKSGVWFDYNFVKRTPREHFYPSNVFPIYVGCIPKNIDTHYEMTRRYLQNQGVLDYKSGVPASLVETGQQWDMPNGWPPLQDIVVTALDSGGSREGHQMALGIVKKWVYSNWKGWTRTKRMFEKYSVNFYGSRGGGGEYNVQEGFGWTNGVILDFLARYGAEFTLEEILDDRNTCDAATCGANQKLDFIFTILFITLSLVLSISIA